MAHIEFHEARPSGTIEGKVDALYDAYFMMRKQLMFYLSGALDSENVVEAAAVKAGWIYAGSIKANQIDVTEGKIQAAQIETLTVGGNVIMGPNATISWSNVTSKPSIPTTSDITQIAADYIATPNLITNIAQVNDSLSLGAGNTDGTLIFRTGASMHSFNTVNGPYIGFDVYGLDLSGADISCDGNWHFSSATVSGLENSGYVKSSAITSAIAAHVAAYH